jgi:DNA-binding NtrC family response regulator
MTRQLLLRERDTVLRAVLHEALTDEGFEVVRCDSLAELEAAAAGKQVACVLTDAWYSPALSLDQESGAAIARLSALVPVVVMTSHTWGRNTTPEELSVAALLLKPFDLADLDAALKRALERR